MDNVHADVPSHFNQHVKTKAGQPAGRHSMADASVACAICMWPSVVAKHVNFDDYIAAAAEGLSRGLPLAIPSVGHLTWTWGSTYRSCTFATLLFNVCVVTSGLDFTCIRGLHGSIGPLMETEF